MTRTLYLIHHSHTDVGYTDTQPAIERRHAAFLRQAVEIAERRPAFRWVCETFWPVERFLARAAPEDVIRFAAKLQDGQIGLSSNYLNFSELAGPEVLADVCARAQALGQAVGVPVRSAMTADVNGFGWGFAQALVDAGTENLFTCVHTHHGRYPLERPQQGFWWETPRGDRLLVWSGEHYHFGNELGLAPGAVSSYLTKDDCDAEMIYHDAWGVAERRIPRYWERLAQEGYPFDFVPVMISGLRTDNGPPSEAVLDQVERWNASQGAAFPVRMATLDEFFGRLRAEASALAVYRGDWPDWWSDGPASMPRGVRLFRKAQRDLRRARRLHEGAGNDKEAVDALALFAEHTFGHSDSIAAPWRPLAQGIAAHKEAYAAAAAERAGTALAEALAARGAGDLRVDEPFAWRILNPASETVTGLAALEVGHHEYHDRSADRRVVLRRLEDGAALPFERVPVPRGMAFLVPLSLEAGTSCDVRLEVHADEPASADDMAREAGGHVAETPFARLELDPHEGIARWQGPGASGNLLRADAAYAPFQPIYELTPCPDPSQVLRVRSAMGLDRKGRDVRRSTGRLVRVEPVRRSAVRDLLVLHYELESCSDVV
ncbi:MAG: glycoside hydrolase family 38 N-terminal domain-containing protein, partial [Planctomycetota bacterium]